MCSKWILRWTMGVSILAMAVSMSWSEETPTEKKISKRPARQVASEAWTKIKNAKSDISIHEKPKAYWCDLINHCQIPFGNMIHQADDTNEAIRHYVNQFGKHGADADIRWLCIGQDLTMTYKYHPSDSYEKHAPLLMKTEMQMSEQIARRCLRDREFLERYYQASLWSRRFLREGMTPDWLAFHIEHMKEGFAEDEGRWYWWYARNLILLAHAFGRDDILKNIEPDKLNEAYPAFLKWFKENKDYLTLSEDGFRWKLNEKAKKRGVPTPQERLVQPDTPFPELKEEQLHLLHIPGLKKEELRTMRATLYYLKPSIYIEGTPVKKEKEEGNKKGAALLQESR